MCRSVTAVPHRYPALQSFSSVVGPNGSGKSNVIDAMLFVFGKRAKQLRLNKVSELIHNSTHHRNLEMARVAVHFQEIIDLVRSARAQAAAAARAAARMRDAAPALLPLMAAAPSAVPCPVQLHAGCRTTRRTR